MRRTDVIQAIIDKKKARTYLEIGVEHGDNFFPIKARRKVAVDPKFTFSWKYRAFQTLINFHNATASFYETTSDDFFAHTRLPYCFDVVFIDGLHTYHQSLRDVLHSLDNLKGNGVIVMHDCNPPHPAAACPAESYQHAASLQLPGWTGEWNGDVWKTVCSLRATRRDLNVFVLDCDYGLGIITRGEAGNRPILTEKQLDKMDYANLESNRKDLLDLKEPGYLLQFLEGLS